MELVEGDQRSALVVVHRFVENQGDAWTVTSAYLDRFIDEQRVLPEASPAESPELASYLQRLRQMARRTAELQLALASRTTWPTSRRNRSRPPTSRPGPIGWSQRMDRTFDLLARLARRSRRGRPRTWSSACWQARGAIASHIRQLLPPSIGAVKIRHHGDFHLGQMLIVKDDVFIIDFEGEPRRSLDERRQKAPAARDVAGLIRSIDYSTTAALLDAVNLTAEERAILDPKLEVWREQATEAFWRYWRAP